MYNKTGLNEIQNLKGFSEGLNGQKKLKNFNFHLIFTKCSYDPDPPMMIQTIYVY